MAWPCITRACCINRFWSELDKADIAVPLVFTKYSNVSDEQLLHLHQQAKQPHPQARVTIEKQPSFSNEEEAPRAPPVAGAAEAAEGSSASVMRQDFRAWKVRPEPSCKPKNDYHPSETPFNNETQYQKDFKPWPIPNKRDHPWIPKPSPASSVAVERTPRSRPASAPAEEDSGMEKSEIADRVHEKEVKERKKNQVKKEKVAENVSIKGEAKQPGSSAVEGKGRAAADALNRQIKREVTAGSSYRNEFKAYADVKPVKPIKAKSQYVHPVEGKANLETSYNATFKGEQTKHLPTDNKITDRRRIRSLYNDPSKEFMKAEKPSTPKSKPKKMTSSSLSKPAKMTSSSKPVKKAKEKQLSSVRGAKKKASEKEAASTPGERGKKESKEINNKLAEAKE